MKIVFSLLYFFLQFTTGLLMAGQEYNFKKITTKDGLSHSTTYAITQDADGFIWFGTREGLNKYNSYDIKTFYVLPGDSTGLNSNVITALSGTTDGRVYIGTSEGLNVYDRSTDLIKRIRLNNTEVGKVNQIYESSDQTIYICSNNGLYTFNDHEQLEQLITGSPVLAISEYKKNVFWLATKEKILLINRYGEIIKNYQNITSIQGDQLRTTLYYCIVKDTEGISWFGTTDGLYQYLEDEDSFEKIIPNHTNNPIEVNMVRTVSEDERGNLWIGTESGLFVYDKHTESFDHYSQSYNNSPHFLSDKAIYSIYQSREGIMWIGTYFGGVNFVKPREKGFYTLIPDGGKNALSGKAISQITQGPDENLWIGTEDGGISIYDRRNKSFSYLNHLRTVDNSLSVDNVHAIYADSRNNVWIGTFLGGLNKYDISKKTYKHFLHNPSDPQSISNNSVYAILEDSRGNLWIGTQKGLNIFNYKKNQFIQFKPDYFNNKFIYDIIEDHHHNLWFCTRESGIIYYQVDKDEITWYNKDHNAHGLQSNKIVSVYQDTEKRLWFGSLNGGLIGWDSLNNQFYHIRQEDGLPNNNVYGILEDHHGFLWISTNKGLSKIGIPSLEVINYNISHGLSDNQFNFKSFYKDKKGWMYFGTINGLTYFHPDSLDFNETPPSVFFTDLKLFNEPVPINEKSILSSHIDETNEIVLKYRQKVITFEFVALNYFTPGNNYYSYYLEGFEETWNKPDNKRSATYTNLSPGTYHFHLKAANNNGVWTENARSVKIIISPPFWLSNWAFILYTAFLAFLVFLYAKYVQYRSREKMAFNLERMEKEKIKDINQHKLNFFTYISHEFKTPLTLILASVEKFLSENVYKVKSSEELLLIKRNAGRLHHLINQLMDFRRIESDHETIHLKKGDIILFLKDTFSAFIPLFAKKHIHYHVNSNFENFFSYFDADKIEKILTNLISNAIKNTQEFGEIRMNVDIVNQNYKEASKKLVIDLYDSGTGIMENETKKVLLPFYQTNNENVKGSGIGLALVNSLINYLKGEMKIHSNGEKGTAVEIVLPLFDHEDMSDKNYKSIEGNKSLLIDQDLFYEEELNDPSVSEKQRDGDFEIMLVEDNKELLNFLAKHFSRKYKIYTATDGKQALEKIQRSTPDIIISDVIMSKIDGITLCSKIKSNINTSHIPFILLTAKSNIVNKIEALDVGADAYLPKPFNLMEIELVVKNMIESRNNLRKHFIKFGNIQHEQIPVNNKDQEFLNHLTAIVHEHLDDPDFNITYFTKEAGISRTLLHLKLKKLVNLSTSEFVKTIRLQKAAQLLREGQSISQAAYAVGFNDPNYFSRSFKEKYKVTPSDYKQSDI